ncbi:MAG: tRNA-intron lyase [Candidatus Micrarchaeota archaeon]|nr:tRNA-intron lyase [Candidatus Micrarchaeota archaeon]
MGLRLEYERKSKIVSVSDPESVGTLQRSFYGTMKKGVIALFEEEALYLMDIRNAQCHDTNGNVVGFNELAADFVTGLPKLMARYSTYKDWRDRGLIIRPSEESEGNYGRSAVKKYPPGSFSPPSYAMRGVFLAEDLMCIIDDEVVGREIYDNYWLGQFGSYKADHRGRLSKLDVYETMFMMKHCDLAVDGYNMTKLRATAEERRPDFESMYAVYEDWRLRGYVLKTGFKFGTHFRLYFPGASPKKSGDEWIHSRHVVQVFPRRSRLLISEWARAIRVAHSVKKTFILAIPGSKAKSPKKPELDFLLYHRKKGGIETPADGKPRYLMLSLSEEEQIGGAELAGAIERTKEQGLELILAISDRETSVTYYRVRRIELPSCKYEYYEIEWEQP